MPVIGGYDPTDKDNNGNEKTKWVTVTEFVSGVIKRKALDTVVRDGEGQIADPSKPTLQAGENHIGEVGGNTKILRMNPTIQTTLYTSGTVIGGLITLTEAMRKNAGTGLISNLVGRVASNVITPALEITFFSDNPSSSTVADGQTYILNSEDIDKCVATFNLNPSDYVLTGGTYRAKSSDSYQGVESISTSQNLYAVIVAKADVTFPSTKALHIKLDELRD
ncbi:MULTISPECIES: hypothetical protein [Methanobacterium]|uniref:Uncharacterized protein n=1 Tax=Methanobacterium bryantii TaxID=2161 RepID=A0A2A2H8N5_METBR|nr:MULTISPECIES: hypothetical protein [Methanobacterium]OEC87881.1 hypothetical protein A9507_06815 [Methanobacterium sp. A39]PAV05748.1 hypothetical protein ASJ80_08425 [Methanobacterium bryantii]